MQLEHGWRRHFNDSISWPTVNVYPSPSYFSSGSSSPASGGLDSPPSRGAHHHPTTGAGTAGGAIVSSVDSIVSTPGGGASASHTQQQHSSILDHYVSSSTVICLVPTPTATPAATSSPHSFTSAAPTAGAVGAAEGGSPVDLLHPSSRIPAAGGSAAGGSSGVEEDVVGGGFRLPHTLRFSAACSVCCIAGLPSSLRALMMAEKETSDLPGTSLPESMRTLYRDHISTMMPPSSPGGAGRPHAPQPASWSKYGNVHRGSSSADVTGGTAGAAWKPAIVTSSITIETSASVAFIGIHFSNPIRVVGSSVVHFIGCTFSHARFSHFCQQLMLLKGANGGDSHHLNTTQPPSAHAFSVSSCSAAASIEGHSQAFFYQCDIYGGPSGTALSAVDHSVVHILDSSFYGPTITTTAVLLHHRSSVSIAHTNIQGVIGCGVVAMDNAKVSISDTLLRDCGVVGIMATAQTNVEVRNCGVERSGSGTNVSLSGAARCRLACSTITTYRRRRFPRRRDSNNRNTHTPGSAGGAAAGSVSPPPPSIPASSSHAVGSASLPSSPLPSFREVDGSSPLAQSQQHAADGAAGGITTARPTVRIGGVRQAMVTLESILKKKPSLINPQLPPPPNLADRRFNTSPPPPPPVLATQSVVVTDRSRLLATFCEFLVRDDEPQHQSQTDSSAAATAALSGSPNHRHHPPQGGANNGIVPTMASEDADDECTSAQYYSDTFYYAPHLLNWVGRVGPEGVLELAFANVYVQACREICASWERIRREWWSSTATAATYSAFESLDLRQHGGGGGGGANHGGGASAAGGASFIRVPMDRGSQEDLTNFYGPYDGEDHHSHHRHHHGGALTPSSSRGSLGSQHQYQQLQQQQLAAQWKSIGVLPPFMFSGGVAHIVGRDETTVSLTDCYLSLRCRVPCDGAMFDDDDDEEQDEMGGENDVYHHQHFDDRSPFPITTSSNSSSRASSNPFRCVAVLLDYGYSHSLLQSPSTVTSSRKWCRLTSKLNEVYYDEGQCTMHSSCTSAVSDSLRQVLRSDGGGHNHHVHHPRGSMSGVGSTGHNRSGADPMLRCWCCWGLVYLTDADTCPASSKDTMADQLAKSMPCLASLLFSQHQWLHSLSPSSTRRGEDDTEERSAPLYNSTGQQQQQQRGGGVIVLNTSTGSDVISSDSLGSISPFSAVTPQDSMESGRLAAVSRHHSGGTANPLVPLDGASTSTTTGSNNIQQQQQQHPQHQLNSGSASTSVLRAATLAFHLSPIRVSCSLTAMILLHADARPLYGSPPPAVAAVARPAIASEDEQNAGLLLRSASADHPLPLSEEGSPGISRSFHSETSPPDAAQLAEVPTLSRGVSMVESYPPVVTHTERESLTASSIDRTPEPEMALPAGPVPTAPVAAAGGGGMPIVAPIIVPASLPKGSSSGEPKGEAAAEPAADTTATARTTGAAAAGTAGPMPLIGPAATDVVPRNDADMSHVVSEEPTLIEVDGVFAEASVGVPVVPAVVPHVEKDMAPVVSESPTVIEAADFAEAPGAVLAVVVAATAPHHERTLSLAVSEAPPLIEDAGFAEAPMAVPVVAATVPHADADMSLVVSETPTVIEDADFAEAPGAVLAVAATIPHHERDLSLAVSEAPPLIEDAGFAEAPMAVPVVAATVPHADADMSLVVSETPTVIEDADFAEAPGAVLAVAATAPHHERTLSLAVSEAPPLIEDAGFAEAPMAVPVVAAVVPHQERDLTQAVSDTPTSIEDVGFAEAPVGAPVVAAVVSHQERDLTQAVSDTPTSIEDVGFAEASVGTPVVAIVEPLREKELSEGGGVGLPLVMPGSSGRSAAEKSSTELDKGNATLVYSSEIQLPHHLLHTDDEDDEEAVNDEKAEAKANSQTMCDEEEVVEEQPNWAAIECELKLLRSKVMQLEARELEREATTGMAALAANTTTAAVADADADEGKADDNGGTQPPIAMVPNTAAGKKEMVKARRLRDQQQQQQQQQPEEEEGASVAAVSGHVPSNSSSRRSSPSRHRSTLEEVVSAAALATRPQLLRASRSGELRSDAVAGHDSDDVVVCGSSSGNVDVIVVMVPPSPASTSSARGMRRTPPQKQQISESQSPLSARSAAFPPEKEDGGDGDAPVLPTAAEKRYGSSPHSSGSSAGGSPSRSIRSAREKRMMELAATVSRQWGVRLMRELAQQHEKADTHTSRRLTATPDWNPSPVIERHDESVAGGTGGEAGDRQSSRRAHHSGGRAQRRQLRETYGVNDGSSSKSRRRRRRLLRYQLLQEEQQHCQSPDDVFASRRAMLAHAMMVAEREEYAKDDDAAAVAIAAATSAAAAVVAADARSRSPVQHHRRAERSASTASSASSTTTTTTTSSSSLHSSMERRQRSREEEEQREARAASSSQGCHCFSPALRWVNGPEPAAAAASPQQQQHPTESTNSAQRQRQSRPASASAMLYACPQGHRYAPPAVHHPPHQAVLTAEAVDDSDAGQAKRAPKKKLRPSSAAAVLEQLPETTTTTGGHHAGSSSGGHLASEVSALRALRCIRQHRRRHRPTSSRSPGAPAEHAEAVTQQPQPSAQASSVSRQRSSGAAEQPGGLKGMVACQHRRRSPPTHTSSSWFIQSTRRRDPSPRKDAGSGQQRSASPPHTVPSPTPRPVRCVMRPRDVPLMLDRLKREEKDRQERSRRQQIELEQRARGHSPVLFRNEEERQHYHQSLYYSHKREDLAAATGDGTLLGLSRLHAKREAVREAQSKPVVVKVVPRPYRPVSARP